MNQIERDVVPASVRAEDKLEFVLLLTLLTAFVFHDQCDFGNTRVFDGQ